MPVIPPRIDPDFRLVRDPLVIQAQAQGQPEGGAAGTAQPPGSERVEGAFGVFGMMISGLIIVFALVILVLRARRRG